MTQQRKNFDRAYKLHAACAISATRTELAYISFRNGYAYANNGAMAVKADLSRISAFHPSELKIMEGRSIHMDNFRRLLNYQNANVTEQGFEVNDQGRRMLIYFAGQLDIEIDNLDDLFSLCAISNMVSVHKTFVKASLIRIAAASIGSDDMRFDFYDAVDGTAITRISPLPLLGSAEAIIYDNE